MARCKSSRFARRVKPGSRVDAIGDTKTCWVDSDGNMWDENRYSRELAGELSLGMQCCENCINCWSCFHCVDCIGCTFCRDCVKCAECLMSDSCTNSNYVSYSCKCVGCRLCLSCSLCKQCDSCNHCRECSDCQSAICCSNCSRIKGPSTNYPSIGFHDVRGLYGDPCVVLRIGNGVVMDEAGNTCSLELKNLDRGNVLMQAVLETIKRFRAPKSRDKGI